MRRERTLLERERELTALRAACARAADGDGSMLAVQGPAGIGKTALLEEAVRAARAAGLTPFTASGTELERELAFGVVRQLLEPPVRALADRSRDELLEGAAALAAPVILAPEPGHARPEAAHAVLHGLYWLTVELAARKPLLLMIDDAHWADAPSLRAIAYIARRLQGSRVLVVIASRDLEPGADTALLEQVLADAGGGLIFPRPLSEAGVERWLAAAYDRPPDPGFVRSCSSATGGNPFLLAALTAALRDEGAAPDAESAARVADVAPATIARSVLPRLARLGPDAVAVAESVAVLSGDARLDRVATLSGVPLDRTGDVVDHLSSAAILSHGEPLAFAHPVLATAVHEQMPPARRGLWHATAARMLIDQGADVGRAAGHLLLAPPGGDPTVVEVFRSAAAAAVARGAADGAVRLLRRALAEPPRDRFDVLLELASAETAAVDASAAVNAKDAFGAARTPMQRAQAAIVATNALLQAHRLDEALGLLAAAEGEADGLDTTTRQQLQVSALMAVAFLRAADLEERLLALRVDELPGETPAERALLSLRTLDLTIRARPRDKMLAIARRLLAGEDPSDPEMVWSTCTTARSLAIADMVVEARDVLTQLIHGGRRRGAIEAVTYASTMRAETELRAGRLTNAEADARHALELSLEHAMWLTAGSLAFLVEALLALEPPSQALTVIAEHGFDTDEQLRPGVTTNLLLHARGRARAATGDSPGGVADLRACGEAQISWGETNPASIPWRSSLALALRTLDQTDEAERLVEEELELAEGFGAGRAIGIALHARARLRRGDRAIDGLREAVDVLAASPARLEHASAVVALGAALRRAGRRTEARDTLLQGLDASDRCGARQLSGHARAELHAAGARPRRERLSGPQSLTASERRVAEMAADGLTNRQIAQALFVTTKTVEMHLGHTYSKLDINRRAELRTALAGDETPGAAAV